MREIFISHVNSANFIPFMFMAMLLMVITSQRDFCVDLIILLREGEFSFKRADSVSKFMLWAFLGMFK